MSDIPRSAAQLQDRVRASAGVIMSRADLNPLLEDAAALTIKAILSSNSRFPGLVDDLVSFMQEYCRPRGAIFLPRPFRSLRYSKLVGEVSVAAGHSDTEAGTADSAVPQKVEWSKPVGTVWREQFLLVNAARNDTDGRVAKHLFMPDAKALATEAWKATAEWNAHYLAERLVEALELLKAEVIPALPFQFTEGGIIYAGKVITVPNRELKLLKVLADSWCKEITIATVGYKGVPDAVQVKYELKQLLELHHVPVTIDSPRKQIWCMKPSQAA